MSSEIQRLGLKMEPHILRSYRIFVTTVLRYHPFCKSIFFSISRKEHELPQELHYMLIMIADPQKY